ncbi:MAG TPA: IS3 family transposase [Candidatus Bipolaricaulis sp.]|nr:IS3 family transposase [Candidatus Bipolaricaulis sp.]HRS13556.1 IS3 family transposase [Candidatus Bipolaricaulis sp.]HRU22014.1 IS3 family transposase [Candidatus Bipolaricaulis sp.]
MKYPPGNPGRFNLAWERDYSQRRGCALVRLSRSSFRYLPRPREDEGKLTDKIRELAWEHPAYGYRRIAVLLWREMPTFGKGRSLLREGSQVDVKRVHRIWKQEGLQVPRRKPRKRRMGPKGEVTLRPERPNQLWTYDFLEDRTEDGKKLRILTVLDEYTRECLNITVGTSIPADKVIGILDWLFLTRGVPEHLRSDNGPEFVARAVQGWLNENGCQTIYITPGSPWENPYIESFHDKLREECLTNLSISVRETQEVVEAWREEYNVYRPHSSLGYLTPEEYAAQSCVEAREVVEIAGVNSTN